MRLKKNQLNYFFHPFEIAISGFSNTGKTTLVSKLVGELSKNHRVGYLKHDAHNFKVDYPGKDTDVIRQSGATDTLINDKKRFAYISDMELDQATTANLVHDNDMLIIEGHKYSQIPKLLFIGKEEIKQKVISEVNTGEIKNIIALICENKSDENPFPEYPMFCRDDITGLSTFIQSYFSELIPKVTYGLVLTGGYSKRMQQDKGGLKYYEKDQVTHSSELLAAYCEKVFVSCRVEQADLDFLKEHQQIHDSFPSVGPSSGILSAMQKYPNVSWVILACDLPYLKTETIKHLINNRNPFKNATCFLNPTRGWPEPLCTLYEPKAYQKLIQYFAMNKPCPRKVLFNSEIQALELLNKNDLDNVNTPSELNQAQSFIEKQRTNI